METRARGPRPDGELPGRRELAASVAALAGLSLLADGPLVWAIVACTLVGTALGGLHVLAAGRDDGVPVESLVLPSVGAAAGVGLVRLVPGELGWVGLAGAIVALGVAVDRILAFEARLVADPHRPTEEERRLASLAAVAVAFGAFVAIAALVPGALGDGAVAGAPTLPLGSLLWLAAADAFVATLVGYRLAALRTTDARAAATSAVGYGALVAIADGALRALAVPRLLGPALLTLVLFLWDALRPEPGVARRDVRRIWEVGLLALVGAIVVALNARLT